MTQGLVVLLGVVIYFAILIGIGTLSYRMSYRTPEDFFVARRGIGSFALLIGIFATNMTAFFMLGIPGAAYHNGIGIYGWVAAPVTILTPLFFYLIGYPCWILGKHYGYMTPPEIFGARWNSRPVTLTMFALLTFYTIPYLVLGVIGGGLAFDSMTDGLVPYWVGGLLVLIIVFAYVLLGGLRGTAWANVFQGLLFLVFLVIAFFWISGELGGLTYLTQRLVAEKPQLLVRDQIASFEPKLWFSYILVPPLAVIMFPHVFIRLLAAKDHRSIRATCTLFPVAIILGWIPVVLIGTWGALAVPGLEGKASDAIMPMMISRYLPQLLVVMGVAAIFATIMSSLDAQILALSTLFARDFLGAWRHRKPMDGTRQILWGRVFILMIGIIIYGLALQQPASILRIADYAFTGYVQLIPVALGALYWPRCTKEGALAAMAGGTLLLFVMPGGPFPLLPASLLFGFMPVVPCLVVTISVLVIVSLLTRPQPSPWPWDLRAILRGESLTVSSDQAT
ncbi:MAG: sodium:solute symporter family protein [Acidobacteria bacterium]|nr:sodium:solute symporter family protein [Acidobacteriota bacterium]